MAWLWVALARKGWPVPLPVKFALGLLLLGLGFLVMTGAARLVLGGHSVWPTWLIITYLLHTIGELCLSPVGLSSVTKLAPSRFVGQMMGFWFLATALGNLIAGSIAGEVTGEALPKMPGLFLLFGSMACVLAALLIVLQKPIKRLMTGVE
jgi:POT family proton-dependent oligopeptide transporter